MLGKLGGDFVLFIVVGFVAQLIDGALGMAYGIAATTALVAAGMPPALASANVHAAEVFTTAASGASHAAARNVDWRIFWRLALAGAVGGAIGAFILSNLDTSFARPFISLYLMLMGVIVIRKAIRPAKPLREIKKVGALGFFGGLCDAVGGGGWGPVVASNLIARGAAPLKVVGTVNIAEFFVTASISAAFLVALGPTFGVAALGLIIGGVIAAPIAAFGARRLPRKTLMILVGAAICMVSAYNLASALGA